MRFSAFMPAIYKLREDTYEDLFDLIALHSSLVDHALVYAINQKLTSKFKRRRKDLDLSEEIKIPVFEWKDDINDRYWTFFPNKGTGRNEVSRNDLFKEEPSYSTIYMLDQYREVDYFIKIEQNSYLGDSRSKHENTVTSLLAISKVVTAYTINIQKLKAKNNLIF